MTSIGRFACCVALANFLILMPNAAVVSEEPVDLELVLAIDSSASVDQKEFTLQLKGLALAFRDPEVHRAIASGPLASIAVTLIEWSSDDRQRVNIPWRRVRGAAAAASLADDLQDAPRLIETGATSISEAIRFSVRQFADNGFSSRRRVIDISGDGYNNQGFPMALARGEASVGEVTVNGMAIENQVLGLGRFYRDKVITGPGSFAMRADDYQDYITAIRRKLIREIRSVPVS